MNKFTSNIQIFSELETEIRIVLSKLQTIDWNTIEETERENILNLYVLIKIKK